eukprot:11389218-Alexandrium_andersonii.AAC.1
MSDLGSVAAVPTQLDRQADRQTDGRPDGQTDRTHTHISCKGPMGLGGQIWHPIRLQRSWAM